MKPTQGFLMVEFLVYICVFSCMSLFFMHIITMLVCQNRKQNALVHNSLQVLTALDLITHEINRAPYKKSSWIKTEEKVCIWHNKKLNKDIELSFNGTTLTRTIGIFNKEYNVWHSKKSNILAQNIKKIQFNYAWDATFDQMNAITCHIQTDVGTLSQTMSLYNGCSL